MSETPARIAELEARALAEAKLSNHVNLLQRLTPAERAAIDKLMRDGVMETVGRKDSRFARMEELP